MKQYHDHLERIFKYGTEKAPARKGMPSSISLFGYQNRYDLKEGFPILTTKEINFNHIATELLWFLRGDTNVKYLIDHKVNIWNEDAYNYYVKICEKQHIPEHSILDYKNFTNRLKGKTTYKRYDGFPLPEHYNLGDCGHQYGKVWRSWNGVYDKISRTLGANMSCGQIAVVDQLLTLTESLKSNPEGRRHIITAIDPVNSNNLALYWCHNLVQFNCRKVTEKDHIKYWGKNVGILSPVKLDQDIYFLDCHLYQRSADMFLGVPYNIASYALLTNILSAILNMIPGDLIHTFGDSHIYENHFDQVNEILSRDYDKYKLPILTGSTNFRECAINFLNDHYSLDDFIGKISPDDFKLVRYESYPPIKAELNTGLNAK